MSLILVLKTDPVFTAWRDTSRVTNQVFASPASGGSGIAGFRALVADDIPNISVNKLTSGVLPITLWRHRSSTKNFVDISSTQKCNLWSKTFKILLWCPLRFTLENLILCNNAQSYLQ